MKVNKHTIKKLHDLQKQDKFNEDDALMYPGAMNEETKDAMSKILHTSIGAIIDITEKNPAKENVLKQIKKDLDIFEDLGLDTEDREMVCVYYNDILEILDIESSDGLLNSWLYGFDPEYSDADGVIDDDLIHAKNALEELKGKIDDEGLKDTFDRLINKAAEK